GKRLTSFIASWNGQALDTRADSIRAWSIIAWRCCGWLRRVQAPSCGVNRQVCAKRREMWNDGKAQEHGVPPAAGQTERDLPAGLSPGRHAEGRQRADQEAERWHRQVYGRSHGL